MACRLTAPSHYLNQCWDIINWTLGNKHQWNLNQNSCIFIQEDAFENVIWKMVDILYRPQCVNPQVASCFNSLRPEQNGWHVADNILKCNFLNEKCYMLIQISLKFDPKGLIDNKPGLGQMMASCQTDDKPLPEPRLTQTNIWCYMVPLGRNELNAL